MSERFGKGKCALCCPESEPIWKGRTDINGAMMQAHLHRLEAYASEHRITALVAPGDPVLVAGTFAYESGGILRPESTRAIVLAHNLMPHLLRLWRASAERERQSEHDSTCDELDPIAPASDRTCTCGRDASRAALEALDQAAAKELATLQEES